MTDLRHLISPSDPPRHHPTTLKVGGGDAKKCATCAASAPPLVAQVAHGGATRRGRAGRQPVLGGEPPGRMGNPV
jgi:hypothetical protein